VNGGWYLSPVEIAATERRGKHPAGLGFAERGILTGSERYRGLKFAGRKRVLSGGSIYRAKESIYPSIDKSGEGKRPITERETPPHQQDQVLFVDAVLRRAGLNPAHYRIAPLVRRIPACLRALKVETMAAALRETESSPTRLMVALNAILIGTTSFFRDQPVFEELDCHVIPDLLGRVAEPRIWSAASSDGAELYSVAMMFARHGAESAFFLGTDCRTAAVERAREGVYPLAATIEMPESFSRDYLHLSDNKAKVIDNLRARVVWEEADILTCPVALRFDLVLCRNIAIYLEPEPMERLWKKLSGAIAPGGYLVVGRAEKPQLDGFSCVAPCLYRKHPLVTIP
jgi:chemotaxis protein methyltransferase CheR